MEEQSDLEIWFVTHAEVEIDPNVPVPDWGLSEVGRQRTANLASAMRDLDVKAIYSSKEKKAIDSADLLHASTGAPVTLVEKLHENDRSATGFLPPSEFQQVADEFFARPEESVRGWERAIDAQRRITSETQKIADFHRADSGVIVIVAHGGVGTLLLCALQDMVIARKHDQPGSGGGNVFTYDPHSFQLLDSWQPFEDVADTIVHRKRS